MNSRYLYVMRQQVNAHAFADRINSGLGGAVNVSFFINILGSDGAEVDDMPTFTFNHERYHGLGNIEQTFDIGVDHRVPVVDVGGIKMVAAQRQPGVVHQDIDGLPFFRQVADGRLYSAPVLHIKRQEITSS